MRKRTKRTLSRALALVMAVTLLCAASLLTACAGMPDTPDNSGADAADLDKADDFSQSEEMGRKQLAEDTPQPEDAPLQIDSQPQEKKQPGTPQPENTPMQKGNPTPTPNTGIERQHRGPGLACWCGQTHRVSVNPGGSSGGGTVTPTPSPVTPEREHVASGTCWCGYFHNSGSYAGSGTTNPPDQPHTLTYNCPNSACGGGRCIYNEEKICSCGIDHDGAIAKGHNTYYGCRLCGGRLCEYAHVTSGSAAAPQGYVHTYNDKCWVCGNNVTQKPCKYADVEVQTPQG